MRVPKSGIALYNFLEMLTDFLVCFFSVNNFRVEIMLEFLSINDFSIKNVKRRWH